MRAIQFHEIKFTKEELHNLIVEAAKTKHVGNGLDYEFPPTLLLGKDGGATVLLADKGTSNEK